MHPLEDVALPLRLPQLAEALGDLLRETPLIKEHRKLSTTDPGGRFCGESSRFLPPDGADQRGNSCEAGGRPDVRRAHAARRAARADAAVMASSESAVTRPPSSMIGQAMTAAMVVARPASSATSAFCAVVYVEKSSFASISAVRSSRRDRPHFTRARTAWAVSLMRLMAASALAI